MNKVGIVFLVLIVWTFAAMGINIFSGFFVFLEILAFGVILGAQQEVKATKYLADKYDETKK